MDTSTLKIGDAISLYQNRGRFTHYTHYTTGNVMKVTPKSGQIVVMLASGNEIRLNRQGIQLGADYSEWRLDSCTPEERAGHIAAEKRRKEANDAVQEIKTRMPQHSRLNWSQEDLRVELAYLQSAIAEARLKVEAM